MQNFCLPEAKKSLLLFCFRKHQHQQQQKRSIIQIQVDRLWQLRCSTRWKDSKALYPKRTPHQIRDRTILLDSLLSVIISTTFTLRLFGNMFQCISTSESATKMWKNCETKICAGGGFEIKVMKFVTDLLREWSVRESCSTCRRRCWKSRSRHPWRYSRRPRRSELNRSRQVNREKAMKIRWVTAVEQNSTENIS